MNFASRLQTTVKALIRAMIVHPESLGILSMQERARILSGKIVFTSNTGKGTRVVLTVPIHNGRQSGIVDVANTANVTKAAMAGGNSL